MGGWVRDHPNRLQNLPEDLPVYLSQSLTEWFRPRLHLRMRLVVLITHDGTTMELHASFDCHVFPPTVFGLQAD